MTRCWPCLVLILILCDAAFFAYNDESPRLDDIESQMAKGVLRDEDSQQIY